MTDTSRTMSRLLPGLHEGKDLRTERVDGSWRTEVRMRDVAHAMGESQHSGLYEYHPDGKFTPIGSFRTLRIAEIALEMLKAGSHFVRAAHSVSTGTGVIDIPTTVVTYAEAHLRMVEIGLVGDAADEPTGPSPR